MRARVALVGTLGAGALVAALASSGHAQVVRPEEKSWRLFATAGLGLPEVAHASVGTMAGAHASIAVRGNLTLFNPMLGVEAFWAFGAARDLAPPRHALLVGGSAMVNPTLGGFETSGHGETIAATLNPTVGYAFLSAGGFLFRVLASVIVYHQGTGTDAHFEAGPSVTAGAGFAW